MTSPQELTNQESSDPWSQHDRLIKGPKDVMDVGHCQVCVPSAPKTRPTASTDRRFIDTPVLKKLSVDLLDKPVQYLAGRTS